MREEKLPLRSIMWSHGYTKDGIPFGRLHTISCPDGTKYFIKPLDTPDSRIYRNYEGADGFGVLPTEYAVFVRKPEMPFSQQVSKWYLRYGYAVRKMGMLAREHELKLQSQKEGENNNDD